MPLVTLSLTAAAVSYNLRELETWYQRASQGDTLNPLLPLYAEHPLHQRTRWQDGFSMLTPEQAGTLDDMWSATAKTNDDLRPAA
jgi:hypothetical protein